jgi:hypothetical protein
VPKMLRNGKGEYYEIAVKEDGTSIRVERAYPKIGILRVKSPEGEMTVTSEYGRETLVIPQEQWCLPVGSYTPYGIELRKKDAEGRVWTLWGYWPDTNGKAIRIAEGKETELVLGTPLKATTTATRNGDQVNITFTLTGVSGETYMPGAGKDGKREPAPKLRIVAKSGLELATGQFEYG